MRDLERLQDVVEYRVSPSQLRLALLGVLAVACAIFAVGVSVGKRLEPSSSGLAIDPLAELERATRASSPSAPEEEEETPQLTYHDELTTRPSSARRSEAAAAEEAPAEEAPQGRGQANAEGAARRAAPQSAEPLRDEPALPEELNPGESSVFTLQVASFETREEAQQFLNELRSRGHQVFLVRTSTPERGTWYRVRVGPFHTRREATTYQSRFERQERLPTFLVQRRR